MCDRKSFRERGDEFEGNLTNIIFSGFLAGKWASDEQLFPSRASSTFFEGVFGSSFEEKEYFGRESPIFIGKYRRNVRFLVKFYSMAMLTKIVYSINNIRLQRRTHTTFINLKLPKMDKEGKFHCFP